MSIEGILFAIGGVFSIIAALFNWDWFMNSRKARIFVRLFSRNGARVFYLLLGIFLIVIGVLASILEKSIN